MEKGILLHLKSECHGIFSQNLRHFRHKSKKIHFWKTKFSKVSVGIDFVPAFYFIKKLIVYLFSVIFGQTDQPTVAGDILAALLQCFYHIKKKKFYMYNLIAAFLIDNTITSYLVL